MRVHSSQFWQGYSSRSGRQDNPEFKNKKHERQVSIFTSTAIESIEIENGKLASVLVRNSEKEQKEHLKIDGIFVYMGHETQTELFEDVITVNKQGYIEAGEDALEEISDKEEDFIDRAINPRIESRLGCQAVILDEDAVIEVVIPDQKQIIGHEH